MKLTCTLTNALKLCMCAFFLVLYYVVVQALGSGRSIGDFVSCLNSIQNPNVNIIILWAPSSKSYNSALSIAPPLDVYVTAIMPITLKSSELISIEEERSTEVRRRNLPE